MSSTELTLDLRDIIFAIKEWLPINQLSESEKFSEFELGDSIKSSSSIPIPALTEGVK